MDRRDWVLAIVLAAATAAGAAALWAWLDRTTAELMRAVRDALDAISPDLR